MVLLHKFAIKRDEFERRLGGGIPSGSIMLIEGGYGAGKSVICQRMSYGFIENKHSVTYISSQLTTKNFINQMHALDYPIAKALFERRLIFIPLFPLIQSPKPRYDFPERLMTAKQLFETEVIVIDSFSTFISSIDDGKKIIQLMSFFKKLSGLNKTIILTANPAELNEEALSILRSSADVYLELSTRILGGDVKHMIEVKKFVGARGSFGSIIGFRVEPKIGFVVEITSVA
jgi:flagellar protein FlaH